MPIAFGVANTGSYSWTMPEVTTSEALVRVSRTWAERRPADVSNAPFTITRADERHGHPVRSTSEVPRQRDANPGAAWNTRGLR